MRLANPLGAYESADTPLARIDARVKLVVLLALTVAVFAVDAPVALAIWYALLLACMRAARMSAVSVARSVRPVLVILLFTLAANAFALDGTGGIALVGSLGFNPAGAVRGITAVLRIVLLVGFACCVSASTTPPELSDACVRLLRPLGRLGVPVADIGLVLSLALRFIPVVSEEYRRIQLAQRVRGVRFDEGPLVARIRVWASVLTPLVVGLFRRADRLAESMAARCYTDGSLATQATRPLSARDRGILAACLAVVTGTVVLARVLL